MYLVFEMFQETEFKEMLAISYLVLQACSSVLRCFRQEWRISVLPCSHKIAIAHSLSQIFVCYVSMPESMVRVGPSSKGLT